MIDHFVIDPPWQKSKGGLRKARPNQGKLLDYATMSVTDIFALLDKDIFPLASPTHNIFLWSVDKFLHAGESEMINRGYRLHARLIWDKTNGVAPAFTVRYSHEYLLWFYKPKMIPISKDKRGSYTTVIRCLGREHSRKPDEAYAMIDGLYPDGDRMDVFSREKRDGWLQYGNEVGKFG
jgi:N6-adenosine-specific RNA methylase IME4